MDNSQKKHCMVCGKELKAGQKGRPAKFCGAECRNKRRKLPNTATHQMPQAAKCVWCGSEFELTSGGAVKCCSRKCAFAYGRRREVEEIRNLASAHKAQGKSEILRDWILNLYYRGYGRTAIAEALGLSLRTIKHWIERYEQTEDGYKRKSLQKPTASRWGTRTYTVAGTEEEWLTTLQERWRLPSSAAIDAEITNRSISLVCGTTNIHKNADSLSAIVLARLQRDPFDGTIYAFCGKKRDKIKYMFWDGRGFRLVCRSREYGAYPWPPSNLSRAMDVTHHDFELILCGERQFSQIITWDSVELSL